MARRFINTSTGQLLALSAGSLLLFGVLALAIKLGALAGFDQAVLLGVRSLASSALDWLVPVATTLGDVVFVAVAALLIGVWLASTGRWAQLTILFTGVLGASALSFILKGIAGRSRPDLWQHLVAETSYSFPSGHATASAALAACLVAMAWHTKWRRWVIAAAVSYIFVIAFTRLYAGVHYPSDILAGWLTAIGWVAAVTALATSRNK